MISYRTPFILVVLAALGGSAACKKSEPDLANVGDRVISKAEFEAYMRYKRVSAEDPKRLERALDDYLQRSALALAVEQEKLLDGTELSVELDELKKEMLISRYFEKYLNQRVGDDAVRNYYDSHQSQYEEKKAHVAHVLVRTSAGMDEATRKAALTRAMEAHSKIRAGADFAEVAKTYSEDRLSSPRGGDLGWVKQGAIDARFAETVSKLKTGEVSEPFLSQYGYHVVKLLEGPTVIKQPFEAVVGDIRYQLRQQAKQAELQRLTSKVKTDKRVAVLKTIRTTRAPEKSANGSPKK
jgi:peptidyl-prolyl cis-trans isomerase C